MDGNVIPINENTTVIVKVSGDLFLQGEEGSEVRFLNTEERIRINQSNDNLYVETHASLDLVVPRRAKVIIEKVGGSAFLEDLESMLVIQKVGGDLALQRLGAVKIEKVGGGCLIEGVSDDLLIHKVGGDLKVRQVAGEVNIHSVGGNLDVQMSGGALNGKAGGEVVVYLTESLSGPVTLNAGDDVNIYIPSTVNGRFRLDSGAEEIRLNLTRQTPALDQTIEERRYEFDLGDGGVLVEMRAGSEISISDETREPEPISGELERRESAWKEARERHGSPSWSGGFGFDRTSAWADMISRRAQEAARRAEQRAQSAMRRTEDQIRMAAEREIRRSDWPTGMPPVPPMPPMPPQPPINRATEQERLMVLQMLKDGKINIEQAESLLAALEGRY